jgi:2-dehydro-3-deoxyphosphogluconate aldolase/(4S)-4-hydroxy-2-oxoglutarate aldolase
MTKEQVRARIVSIGIIPAVRCSSEADARFAVDAVARGGIPIVEITITVPGALDVMADLILRMPDVIVGAGDILDVDSARRCLDIGVAFLTSPALDLRIIELAAKRDVLMLPGALTPTEVITAWQSGADLVKVFPCTQLGGHRYIQALKRPFPHVLLVAAGGITPLTAAKFIGAGATAIGVGTALIPRAAITQHEREWIPELARRFANAVKNARVPQEQSLMAAMWVDHRESSEFARGNPAAA